MKQHFKAFLLDVHPDPDTLGAKKVYDCLNEIEKLAENYLSSELNSLNQLNKELRIGLENIYGSAEDTYTRQTTKSLLEKIAKHEMEAKK